jgi:4-amino-4-deoxy-L-arabinose transferase-like glycosyltransferase
MERGTSPRFRSEEVLLLGAVTLTGFYLGLIYLLTVSPHVDEYSTIWAAQQVIQRGLSLLPSGFFYSQGLLFTYLDALFIGLFGFSEPVARVPSLLVGTVSIPLLYLVGKRFFSKQVGLLAAALLALAPETIIWMGRARMYSLQTLLVLLALYYLGRGPIGGDVNWAQQIGAPVPCRRECYLFTLFFILALFSQTVTVLLLPAVILALAARWSWRWLFRRDVIAPLLLAGLAATVAVLLNSIGGPVTDSSQRPFLALSIGWETKPAFYFREFFWSPSRSLLTLLLILGFIYLLIGTFKAASKGQLADFRERNAIYLFLYGIFGLTMFQLIFLIGETWRRPRYVTMLLPVYFLLAGATLLKGMAWSVSRLRRVSRWQLVPGVKPAVLSLLLVAVATVLFLPETLTVLRRQEVGYDLAFHYVRDRWQPGDAILMPLPSISGAYLGRCDGYTLQRGYREYVVEKDGALVDRWTAAPLLASVRQLQDVLAARERVWFVVDDVRFDQGYNPDFKEYVRHNMKPAYRQQWVTAFLAVPRLPSFHASAFNFADKISLIGYELGTVRMQPGDSLPLSLFWQNQQALEEDYVVFVHLTGRGNGFFWQADGPPVNGLFPTSQWPVGIEVWDGREIAVPTDAPPGRYRLEVGWYAPSTLERLPILDQEGRPQGDTLVLDYLKVIRDEESLSPQNPLTAAFGDSISLLGYDLDPAATGPDGTLRPFDFAQDKLCAGEAFHLRLYWQAREPVGEDYTVFVHLLGKDGQVWGQHDGQPEGGFYPTSFWDQGEVIADEHEIVLKPDTPPGEYQIVTGLYRLATGERLAVDAVGRGAGDGCLLLGTVQVSKP